jgi:D-galactose 1-dehydrogenase
MLEKPPGATLAECHEPEGLARDRGVSLYATWHSREAAMVAPARAWLADKTVARARITWREDVRKWHPGQDWVFAPGGLGVFDPGINALSILTAILPVAVHLRAATLEFPENRQTPIAARLAFSGPHGGPDSACTVTADFDWRQEGPQTWDIAVETDEGRLVLSLGGAAMAVDGHDVTRAPEREYPLIYRRFAELLRARQSEIDASPLRIIADAFLVGRRETTEAFFD